MIVRWGGGCYDQEENVLRANETQYCLKRFTQKDPSLWQSSVCWVHGRWFWAAGSRLTQRCHWTICFMNIHCIEKIQTVYCCGSETIYFTIPCTFMCISLLIQYPPCLQKCCHNKQQNGSRIFSNCGTVGVEVSGHKAIYRQHAAYPPLSTAGKKKKTHWVAG